MLYLKIFTWLLLFSSANESFARSHVIRVASKSFTESFVLAEIMSQALEGAGLEVQREYGLSGTLIAFSALKNDEIDVYVEYSGTVSFVLLKETAELDLAALRSQLKEQNLLFLNPFGFDNSYDLAVSDDFATRLNLVSVSDLEGKKLRAAFGHEFLKRGDALDSLTQKYRLDFEIHAMEHALAYDALRLGHVDVMDVYRTDAKIDKFSLRVLEDTRQAFPKYLAAPLARSDLDPRAVAALASLAGRIDDVTMRKLNAKVEFERQSYEKVARDFLQSQNLEVNKEAKRFFMTLPGQIVKRSLEHLWLTFMAVILATLVAIPLGVLLAYQKRLAQPVLALAGLLQTIPSIAILVFMLPVFGMGQKAAITALFLYSLLPILRNTYTALSHADPNLLESARGIGLYRWEALFFVQIPLGVPLILAGIRTAAVICIGTATLAAFIGAGGLGDFIVEGLMLNDIPTILNGALPAAALAVAIELIFERLEKRVAF